ncbi:MAG: aldo/keto reductase [Methanocorpusculum sp.]|nr:aldo/keto reductase [Methanocorpusculum sp.]
MQYRTNPKNNTQISVLGFGCMRFPRTAFTINQKKTEELLSRAVEAGINYFDTAYVYPGSEAALGKFIAKINAEGHRDKIHIATKLPYRQCKSAEDAEKIFAEQKKLLCTEYIDYYLLHMLADTAAWEKCRDTGIIRWLEEKKKTGEIRNIGFSYHGDTSGFKALVDIYPWDFCQIQLNYLDDVSQAGVAGLKYAGDAGLPVIIMEPLRGGKLVNLPPDAKDLLEKELPGCSPAEFSFRWLWNFPEVTCILSGMNEAEQLEENLSSAEHANPGCLSDESLSLYSSVKEILNAKTAVPCTGCGYCMPCPHGVDIPSVFAAYNKRCAEGFISGMTAYVTCTSMKEKSAAASACIKCGLCEKRCPQGLLIRDLLDETKAVMEGLPYRTLLPIIKKIPGVIRWMSLMM